MFNCLPPIYQLISFHPIYVVILNFSRPSLFALRCNYYSVILRLHHVFTFKKNTEARKTSVPEVTDSSQRTSLCSRVQDLLAGQLGMSCLSRRKTFLHCNQTFFLVNAKLVVQSATEYDPISIGQGPMQVPASIQQPIPLPSCTIVRGWEMETTPK